MARLSSTNLAGMVDSDSEDALSPQRPAPTTKAKTAVTAKRSATATFAPTTKRDPGRPPATAPNRVTKPAPKATKARRISDKAAKSIDAEVTRQALTQKSDNVQIKPAAVAARKGAAPAMAKRGVLNTPPESDEQPKKPAARGRPRKDATAPALAEKKTSRAAATTTKPRVSIAESIEVDEVDANDMEIDELEADVTISSPMAAPPARQTLKVPASVTKRAAPAISSTSPFKRPTSSDDAALRRRLGELTRENEALQAKIRNLREIGVVEAEKTFDQYKKRSEDKAAASAKLITSLKAEVTAQKALSKEGQTYKKQLEAAQVNLETTESQLADAHTTLDTQKAEIKTLNTKLSAARSAADSSGGRNIPGSVMKANGIVRANDGTAFARLKEELYGDLTGLIMVSVKQEGRDDVYDCLQTGRNGTLHFRLSVPSENSGQDYESAEFTYQPELHDVRDRDLIDILPDFLVEEITFPRTQAAKFFSRVMKAMMERVD